MSADERAWQQRIDTAKRGAAELRKANDPVFKANAEYQESLKKLDQSKPFISAEDYKTTLDAITQTRDAAIERANKAAESMTTEEKAVWRTEVAYSALRLELANAKVAAEALSMGDMTVLDTKALERTVDFLTNFAKQAKIIPTSLDDLAQRAGVSLNELQAGFRAIEAETLKLQALKRSKDLGIETEETKRLAAATLDGADAYAKVSREIEVERQLRALGLDAKDKDLASTREEIRLKLEAVEASREYAKAA
ncbi:hypothetical protein [Azospirillum thermophilum]|uniref:Uncharacterized protein n=1 Tax=Azospirillum thermophilum TaxID=2202148 RepID=A0A2S2CPZ0_9PROT|nr:hypothetical protein [Azospirillum thermophilum]AWK86546.1 hypothetical protein DEW08_10110 [Azospirillum thermophilum]